MIYQDNLIIKLIISFWPETLTNNICILLNKFLNFRIYLPVRNY